VGANCQHSSEGGQRRSGGQLLSSDPEEVDGDRSYEPGGPAHEGAHRGSEDREFRVHVHLGTANPETRELQRNVENKYRSSIKDLRITESHLFGYT
jgi:ribosomal protein L16 Arg81 hydroxylase